MASQLQKMSDQVPQRRRLHLKEITGEGASDTIGGLLRATRLKLGEDLKSASRVTKIRPEYLEALEEGKIAALPGRTYAIGFLKTYADFLGLDPAECLAKFKTEHAPPPPVEGELGFVPKESENQVRVPQGTLVIVGVVVILLIYAGVYLFRSANNYMDERAKQPAATQTSPSVSGPVAGATPPAGTTQSGGPASPATGVSSPAAQDVTSGSPAAGPNDAATASSAATDLSSSVEDSPAVPGTVAQTAPAGLAATPNAPPPAITVPSTAAAGAASEAETGADSYDTIVAMAPHSYGAASGPGRIVLRATQNVFVRIASAGPRQQVIYQGVLAKNDVFYVPTADSLVLVTRNGGALELYLDKTPKGPLGPKGVALSGLALTPATFEH
jgi:cytoskeleton protein RodZ